MAPCTIGPDVRIAYGPVPSRRLGRSLGVNNIPPKYCSYSCVYCQLGRTQDLGVRRKRFYGPERVYGDVEAQVRSVEDMGERIDHITFVPDGEPTLDIDLGREIDLVKDLGYPIAVITNSSLLGDENVREELMGTDVVSVKVDSVDEGIWRKVNRPHGSIVFKDILDGMTDLSDRLDGPLITETMLIGGMNDLDGSVRGTAVFIEQLGPKIAYISVPIRPPAESDVQMPTDGAVLRLAGELTSRKIRTVPLTERELGEFTYTGDIEGDILAITSVHPMREDSVRDMVTKAGEDWKKVEALIGPGKLKVDEYLGDRFYRRALDG